MILNFINFYKKQNYFNFIGMVSCLDEAVANVTTIFKKYGLWENTVMIFSTGKNIIYWLECCIQLRISFLDKNVIHE